MKIPRLCAAAGCAIALCLPSPAFAQQDVTSASVTGRVTDPSGAVVVGAHVSAKNLDTNRITTADTDKQGRLRFQFLPPGRYEIVASGAGLWPAVRVIDLQVGAAVDLNFSLPLPSARTEDTVYATEQPIETDRSEIAETVRQQEVEQLPFEGRNYLDLSLLLPGVSPTNTAATQTLAETSEVVGQGYSVNSQRNFSNSFVVDGLSANDDAAGVAGNVFSMDAVRELQVVTSGGQAEFGRALGGYFNIITRSGTNDLHGTAYGFLRNQRFAADNSLSGTKLPLTQGQYGFSLSGPVVRNRTFLFGNFEEQRLRTDGVITVTPQNAAAINAKLVAVGFPAPLLPVVSTPTTQYPTTLHTDNVFTRLDHTVSARDRIEARYSFYQLSSLNARGAGSLNEVSNGTSVYDTNHTIAVSNIATLTPHVVNETRAQFVHDDLNAPPNDQIGPAVTISGVAVFGRSTSSPTARYNDLFEIVNNVVIEHGAHAFKTGVDFLYNDDTITYPQSIRGSYTFSSLANFLSGTYNSGGFTQNFGNPTVEQTNPNLGFYAQDEWRASRSITLNLGVRYDLEWLQTITTDTDNVSPRLGIAWSPFHNNGTVVRASYGLFFDRVPLRPLANALLSAHNTTDPTQASFLSYTFSPGQAGAPVFPAVAVAPPAGAVLNYSTMQRNIQNPFSQQASVGVEQQVFRKTTLDVNYEHLRGEHLISSFNLNPTNASGVRPDPTRGNIKPYSSVFDSIYDGLEVSVVQRPVPWGSARISYTWSHAIDDISEFFFSSPINNYNFRVDRSRSDDDQRNRVAFDGVLTSPTETPDAAWKYLTHDWRLSGVLQYYSALPFNITTGGSTAQQTTQRPCTSGLAPSQDSACFNALPGAVIGRNAGIGFDFFTLNARLSRTVHIHKKVSLEAMAEAFNSLNHRNNMIPNGTFGTGSIYKPSTNATFGQPTAVGDPRNVQLALRLSF